MNTYTIIVFILFACSSARCVSQSLDLSDSMPPGKNYKVASFRLWIADKKESLNGTLVLIPGSNGDGRAAVLDPLWQKLASSYKVALLGVYFTDHPHDDMAIEHYADAKQGSGDALLKALTNLCAKSAHPELLNAPLLLWGHSAGGQFNYEFVCWKPERVIGFVVNKGGIYYTSLASKLSRDVPGIFFAGEQDMKFRSDIVKGIFSINRRFGAKWTFAEEPNMGHDIGQTQKLAALFFEAVLNNYFEKNSSSSKDRFPYVGDWHTKSITPIAEWKQKDYPDSWLPNKAFAEAWLKFITGQSVE